MAHRCMPSVVQNAPKEVHTRSYLRQRNANANDGLQAAHAMHRALVAYDSSARPQRMRNELNGPNAIHSRVPSRSIRAKPGEGAVRQAVGREGGRAEAEGGGQFVIARELDALQHRVHQRAAHLRQRMRVERGDSFEQWQARQRRARPEVRRVDHGHARADGLEQVGVPAADVRACVARSPRAVATPYAQARARTHAIPARANTPAAAECLAAGAAGQIGSTELRVQRRHAECSLMCTPGKAYAKQKTASASRPKSVETSRCTKSCSKIISKTPRSCRNGQA